MWHIPNSDSANYFSCWFWSGHILNDAIYYRFNIRNINLAMEVICVEAVNVHFQLPVLIISCLSFQDHEDQQLLSPFLCFDFPSQFAVCLLLFVSSDKPSPDRGN